MAHRRFIVLIGLLLWVLCPPPIGKAAREAGRGSETAREFEQDDGPAEGGPRLAFFDGRITLAFLFELVCAYTDVERTDDKDSGRDVDIYLDSAEFDLHVKPHDAIEARVVAGVESIHKNGDAAAGFLDEATLRLQYPGTPFYFVGGKRTQPFGVFENRLISSTVTEDVYEIVKVGATAGYAPDWRGLDLSLTAYRGQEIIQNLQSFESHAFAKGRQSRNENGAYIASLRLEPLAERLVLNTYYDNEPGDGRRNQSLGGALTLSVRDFNLDCEYITALTRERGDNGDENLENAWFVGLSWEPWEVFEIATRYEHFDADNPADQEEVVDYRWLAGFNYALTDYTILSVEYRYTNFEQASDGKAAASQNELILQIALEF
jgi:opacity protein-like surface antigen